MAKRERSTNWEKEEKQLLREIIKPFMAFIENKNISTNTNKEKLNAWTQITEQFNLANKRPRDKKQLLNQWKLTKLHSKKEVSDYRRQLCQSSFQDMKKYRELENERQQNEHELRLKNMTELQAQVMINLKLQEKILIKILEKETDQK